MRQSLTLLNALAIVGTTAAASVVPAISVMQQQPQDSDPPASQQSSVLDEQTETAAEADQPLDPVERALTELLEEITELKKEVTDLRHELATARMERDEAARELEELRSFIRDHREYGDDFGQYQEIKELTARAERRRAAEEAAQRREEERQRRLRQRSARTAQEAEQLAKEEEIAKYRRAGFNPLGLDVYLGRTGFFYAVEEQQGLQVEYEPIIGHFLEPVQSRRIDYGNMTISGTVLNASEEVRNIGIAVAFFDNRGNQVGSETVQVNNARPNVPYPFTSKLQMALDRPFASSTAWVLYADPVAHQSAADVDASGDE